LVRIHQIAKSPSQQRLHRLQLVGSLTATDTRHSFRGRAVQIDGGTTKRTKPEHRAFKVRQTAPLPGRAALAIGLVALSAGLQHMTLHARPRERRRPLEAPCNWAPALLSPLVVATHFPSSLFQLLHRPLCALCTLHGLTTRLISHWASGTFAHSQPVHFHHSGPPGTPDRPEGAGEVVLRQCGGDSSWHRHTSLSCTHAARPGDAAFS
jgi:hypothetical protein